jgi:[acyl-carrier-protein] S-malonyltransferase
VLHEKGIVPQFAAGHSLGEYSAHVVAGTIPFAQAVRAVHNRGRYMQEAVPAGEGGMAAIVGLTLDQLQQVCAEAAQGQVVSPANINSPDQIVVSGHRQAVERAAELAKAQGARRAVMLGVSAPFHCALMQPAQDRLEKDLQEFQLGNPEIPVISNIDAAPKTTGEGSRQALVRQVTGAVQWAKSMQTLIDLGVKTFIEVGPGKVLMGLMRQIDRSQTCLNAQDEASLKKVSELFTATKE